MIEKELKYWNLTSLKYEFATSEHLLKMEKVLNSEPTKASQVALSRWHDLKGPLSIIDIIA